LLWLPHRKAFNRKVREENRREHRANRFRNFLSVLSVFTPRSLRLKALSG
jgi:hypothetical protein